jgi:hypothetical protein
LWDGVYEEFARIPLFVRVQEERFETDSLTTV